VDPTETVDGVRVALSQTPIFDFKVFVDSLFARVASGNAYDLLYAKELFMGG
jgi:hypothetical protein